MKTVFHAWPYGRFIEKQSNLTKKKLHRTNLYTRIMKPIYCAMERNHWLKTLPLAKTVVLLLVFSENTKFSFNNFWQKNVKEGLVRRLQSTFAKFVISYYSCYKCTIFYGCPDKQIAIIPF